MSNNSISDAVFNAIITDINQMTGPVNSSIKDVMNKLDAYIFLIYDYLYPKDELHNRTDLREVCFKIAQIHPYVKSYYDDFLEDNPESVGMTFDEYINDIFIDGDDDVQEAYTGNGGYEVTNASSILLKSLLNLFQ